MGLVVRPGVCVEVGEKGDREGGRRLSLGARGGGRLLRSQARPGLGPVASDAARAGRPRLRPPAYLLLGRRQLVLPAVVRHLRAGPGHVNPAGGARLSGWAGPKLLPAPGQLRHSATAHARRGCPRAWKGCRWANGREGGGEAPPLPPERLGSRRVRLLCAGAAARRMRPSPVRL